MRSGIVRTGGAGATLPVAPGPCARREDLAAAGSASYAPGMARPALAAARAVDVINFLASRPTEAFTLSDLVRHVDINPASAHALLAVLTEAGYLERHTSHRTYRLGPALVALGNAALTANPAVATAANEAQTIARELHLEVAVTVTAGESILFAARAGEHRPHGVPLHVGHSLPLAPPLGAVFVAWSNAADRDAWLARAPRLLSADERAHQLAVLDAVRTRGYSVGLEDEARRALSDSLAEGEAGARIHDLLVDLGRAEYQLTEIDTARRYDVSMIAAPVFGADGRVVAALTLSGLTPSVDARQVAALGERVRGAALVATKRAHGRAPESRTGEGVGAA
jgi:DNA-binding IclR family transcriptional regulator